MRSTLWAICLINIDSVHSNLPKINQSILSRLQIVWNAISIVPKGRKSRNKDNKHNKHNTTNPIDRPHARVQTHHLYAASIVYVPKRVLAGCLRGCETSNNRTRKIQKNCKTHLERVRKQTQYHRLSTIT